MRTLTLTLALAPAAAGGAVTGNVIIHDGTNKLVDRTCRVELLRYTPAGANGHVVLTLDCTPTDALFAGGFE